LHKQRDEYLAFRRKFEPTSVKLVIVAESPPKTGKYFYDPAGRTTEPLFAALMQQLKHAPATKEDGLREFQLRGWLLVDASYEPVDGVTNKKERDAVITRDYDLLRYDLDRMLSDKSTPVVLIKANVCRLLESRMKEDGFNVLNGGRAVYFPSNGRQPDFRRQFDAVLKSTGKAS
jgi:hypothetical protein